MAFKILFNPYGTRFNALLLFLTSFNAMRSKPVSCMSHPSIATNKYDGIETLLHMHSYISSCLDNNEVCDMPIAVWEHFKRPERGKDNPVCRHCGKSVKNKGWSDCKFTESAAKT